VRNHVRKSDFDLLGGMLAAISSTRFNPHHFAMTEFTSVQQ
jgi:hypothetical protein